MRRKFYSALLLATCLLASHGFGQSQTPTPASVVPFDPANHAPLDQVIAEVKKALKLYQDSIGRGPDSLPPLASAEFDFKVTTATVVGASISLFIFKIGGSHETDVVNDVTFTYSVPPPKKPSGALQATQKPKPLAEELASTIQSAAAAVKASPQLGSLNFSKLAVNIQYGVKWDGNIGANVPIQFVTIGISGDKNKNTVQSVKLTFGK
jgi:hypothetical protein